MLQEEWVKNMSDTTYEEIIKKGLSKRHAKEKRLKKRIKKDLIET